MAGPEQLGKVISEFGVLKLKCGNCGHKACWTARRALAIFGPLATPYDIREALKCTACGEKKSEVWI